jgi:hypothetical protein
MILNGLWCLLFVILNIVDPVTYGPWPNVAAKSVILLDLKSFRIILLRGALLGAPETQKCAEVWAILGSLSQVVGIRMCSMKGLLSHFGTDKRRYRCSLGRRLP